MTLHVFVGYDQREHAAYLVCRDSILNPKFGRKPEPGEIEVHPLSHRILREQGYFDRPWKVDAAGQTWDERDGRPFSTEFSHSRFLVPEISRDKGITGGPVVFVDCDFLFLTSILDMLDGIDSTKAISVVQHDINAVAAGVKMDGMVQQRYFRKLWSSLMVFNMGHPANRGALSRYTVNTAAGAWLHALSVYKDDEIGEIPLGWNFIPGLSADTEIVHAVHWSLGGPWMSGFESAAYASIWRGAYCKLVGQAWQSGNLAQLYRV